MIEFVTLYLGLVLGVIPVEVRVDDTVASFELVLDGESVGSVSRATAEGDTWRLDCDLGQTLAPHELLAIARDLDGDEIGRAEQLLNLPRPRAEARWSLNWQPGSGQASASLIWHAQEVGSPREVSIFLDGELLELEPFDPSHIELPAFDPSAAQLLRAELTFTETVEAEAEIVFGGHFGDQVDTQLTAIPVISKSGGLPKLEAMTGWFLHRGEAVDVAAVERIAADILVVREITDKNLKGLKKLATARRGLLGRSVPIPHGLRLRDRLRFVFPNVVVRKHGGQTHHLMESSGNMARRSSLFGLLAGTFFEPHETPQQQQVLAEAVATAGLMASRSSRARVVLLIATSAADDTSRFSVEAVRGYLRRIQVPLVVWTPDGKLAKGSSPWGEVEAIRSLQQIEQSISRLREDLDSQIVVWLAGSYLPHEIELSEAARGVRLPG